jgi:hypothetical protein
VSLGFSADAKRVRKKVSGSTKAEVRDKLKELHAELDAGVRTVAVGTVANAVDDWLTACLPKCSGARISPGGGADLSR